MSRPFVSIVIPVYNGADFLKQAIESALNQTYENIEVIVVNDGSNDNGETEKISLSYNNRIRYFSKPNGGVATALNLGIEKMRGEYFSWLSHDDLYSPNKIKIQMDVLMKQSDKKAIVYSDFEWINQETGISSHCYIGRQFSEKILTNSVFPIIQGLLHCCTLIIHKSHFKRVGVFDEKLITTQDYDLFFRMMRYQKNIYVNESLVYSRIHNNQGSKTIKCHHKERETLYMKILDGLSECEVCSMFGSSYKFYHTMWSFFKSNNMHDATQYANVKFMQTKSPKNIAKKIDELQEEIHKLSSGNSKQICIFGAGQWGKRLYYELESRSISVKNFSDNDENKWGKEICNKVCISPKELEKQKEDTLVIVAVRTHEEILKQLRMSTFPYITTKNNISRLLFDVDPLKDDLE